MNVSRCHFFFARMLTELRKNPLKSAFQKATAYLLYIKKGCSLRKSVCLGPDPDRSQPIFDLKSSGERWQINMGDAFGLLAPKGDHTLPVPLNLLLTYISHNV